MNKPLLYRKRIIPEECVFLKDDEILLCDDQIILTKWNALKPKKNLHHGFSCYFLQKGFKISKFYQADNSLLYWYCDIVKYEYCETANTLTVTDLLSDVILYPDGFVKVVDLDEIVYALDSGGLSIADMKTSLLTLNNLLTTVYQGGFLELAKYIEDRE